MRLEATAAERRASYQDVLDAPPNVVAEILRGKLYLQPRPATRHALASSSLGGELDGPFHKGRGGPGGWWILDEPELHLGEEVLVPNIAAWRRARLPEFPDVAAVALAPYWACEVLSPRTRQRDLTLKRAIYAEHEVAHLWLVDPDARTLEAFALEEGRWVLLAALHADEAVSVPPFAAISFPLSSLWP